MRTSLLAILLAACASTHESAPAATTQTQQPAPAAAAPARVDQPGPAQQPSPPPRSSTQPDAMTASQAAQLYAQAMPAPKAIPSQTAMPAASDSDEGPCASDADCAFTRVAAGQCCPMLCAPRVVTKAHAKALNDAVSSCNGGKQCPDPLCRPPLHPTRPACVQNKCVAVPSKLEAD